LKVLKDNQIPIKDVESSYLKVLKDNQIPIRMWRLA